MPPRVCARPARFIIVSARSSNPSELSRRELLGAAVTVPLWRAFGRQSSVALPPLPDIRKAPYRVVGGPGAEALLVTREWSASPITCRSRLTNPTDRPVAVTEVVLFEISLRNTPANSGLYGEGFQMLSQSAGTLSAPVDAGSYTDAGHYKMPAVAGKRTFYGLMTIDPRLSRDSEDHVLDSNPTWALAFTSCRRFSGLFRLNGTTSIEIVVDTEGLTIGAGESWDLEEYAHLMPRFGDLRDVADRLSVNHPPLKSASPPTGWCSWYCFGPRVTARQVLDNLDAISAKIPGLTYVQIDDGYQPAMGDWLETGAAFGGDVRKVLDEIRKSGFQPAIWVAPFVAEEGSHVFQQHRDWFVKDADGSPLRSDKVTFGGWRKGPWYVLDGTHPDVHAHFEHVFSTMRKEWGVTYFKLDANFWGAIHGGRFHDPKATRIQAYRRGMQAILRGAGDSFILGCNHPIWPSVGLIHGSRSSNDIKRTWDRIKTTAQQNLLRNWQNGRLWWNDPDAIVLTGDLPDNEFLFHATAIYATGGMLLSGDDLTAIPEPRLAMLKRLLPPTGVFAEFDDANLRIGTMKLPGKQMFCCFNWADTPVTLTKRLYRPIRVTDFWTGESLGRMENRLTLENMPPHSARLLECTDA
jgi:alpha-galactosidase